MKTLGLLNELFLTLVNGFIQWIRLASSAQKPFGSASERSYIFRYWDSLMKARFVHSAGTSKILSDISLSSAHARDLLIGVSHRIMRRLIENGQGSSNAPRLRLA